MHGPALENPACLNAPHGRRSNAAFSLVEVTLALGIIAIAFVALFGLLPTGMQTFRASVDTTNDITILQNMNAMVQVTAWPKIKSLDFHDGDVYYFDEEGRRTDTLNTGGSSPPDVQARRLYQVKLIVEDFYQPGATSKSSANKFDGAYRIIVVIGDKIRPKSIDDFKNINRASDLEKSNGKLDVRSRAFIVTRMESSNDK